MNEIEESNGIGLLTENTNMNNQQILNDRRITRDEVLLLLNL